MKMQPPYESGNPTIGSLVTAYVFAKCKKPSSASSLERLHGSFLTAQPSHRKYHVSFFSWCLAATWFLSRSFPIRKKPARALPRFPKVSDAQYQLLSNSCQEEKR